MTRHTCRQAVALVGMVLSLGLSGCGQQGTPPAPTAQTEASAPAQAPGETGTETAAAQPAAPKPEDRLNQPFADATIAEPPPEWHRPPDTTIAGKSVGKIYTEVERLWNDIPFVSPSGKKIHYRAELDTELGPIVIELLPEAAPNHVRSFVALCRAGYYDGLVFERTVRELVPESPDTKVEYIEAGCPLGTGDVGYGSVGYWLHPEFNELPHEVGTVGASHGVEADTAACKFYINLCPAPFMDGSFTVFGKVTQGLEVARAVHQRPVRDDPEYPEGDRPVEPVVIRKVTVVQTEEP